MRAFNFSGARAAGLLLGGLAVVALVAGCGGPRDGLQAVSGEVTWGGEPLPSGTITLQPLKEGRATGGQIEDGQFEIPASRGAKPGEYRVSIEAYLPTGKQVPSPEVPGEMVDDVKQMIPPKYNSRTELRAQITPDGDNNFPFELEKN